MKYFYSIILLLLIVLNPCNSYGLTTQSRLASASTITYYTIYPNPSSNILNISLSDTSMSPSKSATILAILYDMNGVEKNRVTIIKNIATLDVSMLNKGIYILKININDSVESHQIVVIKELL